MGSSEEQALLVRKDRKLLRKRFEWTISVMSREMKKIFPKKRLIFDFEAGRMYGRCGAYLEWMTRPKPNEEPGYDNQQTSQGHVEIIQPRQYAVTPQLFAFVHLKNEETVLDTMRISDTDLLEYINEYWKLDDSPDGWVIIDDLEEPEYADKGLNDVTEKRCRSALEFFAARARNSTNYGKDGKGRIDYLWVNWE